MRTLMQAVIMITCTSQVWAHHDTDHRPAPANHTQQDQTITGLSIESPQVKSTIPGIKVSSGYLTFHNDSDNLIKLTRVSTPAARVTEFHRMFLRDSKMAMRKVDVIEIAAKTQFQFKPNGHHLMFMGLQKRLEAGQSIEVTFYQDSGQTLTVSMPIHPLQKHYH